MAQQYVRSQEDSGNSIQLEHLNFRQPDQRVATIFYLMGMGFTRDPYLMVGIDNMWVNIGRSQIHLPTTTDITVYNAIFKSLKEHLLS